LSTSTVKEPAKFRDAYAEVMTVREEAEFLFDPIDEITKSIDKARPEVCMADYG
jgi:hypothetical protein